MYIYVYICMYIRQYVCISKHRLPLDVARPTTARANMKNGGRVTKILIDEIAHLSAHIHTHTIICMYIHTQTASRRSTPNDSTRQHEKRRESQQDSHRRNRALQAKSFHIPRYVHSLEIRNRKNSHRTAAHSRETCAANRAGGTSLFFKFRLLLNFKFRFLLESGEF